MRFLDIIVSPFSSGDSATVIFTVGMIFVALICGSTAALLTLHFRKERMRKEKKSKEPPTEI